MNVLSFLIFPATPFGVTLPFLAAAKIKTFIAFPQTFLIFFFDLFYLSKKPAFVKEQLRKAFELYAPVCPSKAFD
jgi:hypothetical protein